MDVRKIYVGRSEKNVRRSEKNVGRSKKNVGRSVCDFKTTKL